MIWREPAKPFLYSLMGARNKFESYLRRQKTKDFFGSPLFLSNPKDWHGISRSEYVIRLLCKRYVIKAIALYVFPSD